MLNLILAWISIDPNPTVFKIPFLNHPIAWYGCIFALAFYLGYKLFIWMYTRHLLDQVAIPSEHKNTSVPQDYQFSKKNLMLINFFDSKSLDADKREALRVYLYLEENKEVKSITKKAVEFSESALLYIILATIIGARLGHIIFYENVTHYLTHPIDIIKTWEGGLASHGGIAAVILAAFIFVRRNKTISFLGFTDLLAAPTMFVCAWIRIGNFINQEILGGPTNLPWGIIFMHPADGGSIAPRHPMQLYEFALYMGVSALLFWLWNKFLYKKKEGLCLGVALLVSFTVRFFLEFLKEPQSIYDAGSYLQMGQILSIPMVWLGIIVIILAKNKKEDLDKKLSEF